MSEIPIEGHIMSPLNEAASETSISELPFVFIEGWANKYDLKLGSGIVTICAFVPKAKRIKTRSALFQVLHTAAK